MSETFEQMALRIWEIECGKTRACSTSKLTLMEITAIAFAAAIRDELAKEAEPVISERDALRKEVAEKNADIERLYRAIDDNWVSQKQIVVSQLRVKQLLEATEWLLHMCEIIGEPKGAVLEKARYALATPTDTTALEAMIAKAGEVMREQALNVTPLPHWDNIRALPAVTLDDLKGGAA